MELRYDGMYVLFPLEDNGYYYFLRLFEEDKASGKMIMGNFAFEELYLSTFYELENKRNFIIEQFGNSIFFNSNLIFDLKGTVYFDKLRLAGQFKNGKPWMNGEVQDYYFIPFNLINASNKVWILSKEKSPISIEISKEHLYLTKQIHHPIDYPGIPMKNLVLWNEQIVGTFIDDNLQLFDPTILK